MSNGFTPIHWKNTTAYRNGYKIGSVRHGRIDRDNFYLHDWDDHRIETATNYPSVEVAKQYFESMFGQQPEFSAEALVEIRLGAKIEDSKMADLLGMEIRAYRDLELRFNPVLPLHILAARQVAASLKTPEPRNERMDKLTAQLSFLSPDDREQFLFTAERIMKGMRAMNGVSS